ncbi:hypothetical protein BACT_0506 [Bifidobacterium actinocoloniiforme DSM 22766]|uniref:Uncharacterized protein n=2 Tax=Bifidobacterium actinocoloniiforme TaxID=638619 RepID=A0A086YZV6_9BIFI|nr:hypothetical protein BACT_0506 [Bifidobacterium actinocoloniiforme DSM 22766]
MDRYRDSQQKVLDEIRGIKFALIANYPPLEKGANSLVKASNFMLDYTLDPSNTKLPRLFVGGDEEEMDLNPQITINLEKAIQTFTKDVQGELR